MRHGHCLPNAEELLFPRAGFGGSLGFRGFILIRVCNHRIKPSRLTKGGTSIADLLALTVLWFRVGYYLIPKP